MKKLPYGISNFEELITDGYYYVDKTPYIEEFENLSEKRIMLLRPRKFGKTLFTSTLENYYDIKKADKFEKSKIESEKDLTHVSTPISLNKDINSEKEDETSSSVK